MEYIANLQSSFPMLMKDVLKRLSYEFRRIELRKRSEAGTGHENKI